MKKERCLATSNRNGYNIIVSCIVHIRMYVCMYMFLSFGSGVGADVRGGVEHLCVPQPHQGGRGAALLPPQPRNMKNELSMDIFARLT